MNQQTLEYAKSELKKYSMLVFGKGTDVKLMLSENISEWYDGYTVMNSWGGEKNGGNIII